LSGFPAYIQAGFLPYSVVLGDVCDDSRLEVCFYADSTERVYVVDMDGEICWFQELGAVADVEGSPVIADVTGDGKAEVLCGYQEGFVVFDSLGNVLAGFPDTGYHDVKMPVVADVEGHGAMAMVVGSADWHVYGYGLGGEQALGFPIQCSNRIEASAAVYDLDEDGRLELMVGPFDYAFYVFDLSSSAWEWPRFRYDPYNSGTYRSGHYPGVAAHDKSVLWSIGLLVAPNPFRQMADIRCQIGASVREGIEPEMSLKIYDVTGRLVKDFSSQVSHIGYRSSVMWHGDDDHGRAVSAGVYFVRLEDADNEITRKIVKIK
ncbi:MAG: T9SS type A sorting domain-containing protein, partial [candidate division WOR-3 bacterium]